MNYFIYTALIYNSVNMPFEVQEAKLRIFLTILCISALNNKFYIFYMIYIHVMLIAN